MDLAKLNKLRDDYNDTRTKLYDLEQQINEGCSVLRKSVTMEKRKASILFTAPSGAIWVTSIDRNQYSERQIWSHNGKKKVEKLFSDSRMSNNDIRLALATYESE